jgi:hypothetical protein
VDNSLSPIEDYINTGLSKRFYKVFGVPLLFYNGPDVKAVVANRLKRTDTKDMYPFARARTSGFALNETSYKPNTLARRGLHGQASHDNTLTYKLSLIPVTTTFEVEIYVQDMRTLRLLSKKWLITSATASGMKFTVNYGVGPIDIDVKLDKQLSVPPREGGLTEVKEYMMTANMTVNGYMSDDLSTSQAVTELDVEGAIKALNQDNDEAVQVFVFENKWPDVEGIAASADDIVTKP